MPPKKGKKKKKSKAELEAERKAQEEEEQRQKEELTRLETERLAKQREEEEKALARRVEVRNDEVDRFIRHREEMSVVKSARMAHLQLVQRKQQDSTEWNAVVGCNEAQWPNASDIASLNTYIAELEEYPLMYSGDALKCINAIDRVLVELECSLLAKSRGEEGIQTLREFSSRLQMVLISKITSTTARILRDCENNEGALDAYDHSNGMVCLYSSPRKNLGCAETLDLSDMGIVFNASCQLSSSEYAFRVCRFPFEPSPHLRFAHGDLTIGGVFHIDLIRRPCPRKAIGEGWAVRRHAGTEAENSLDTPNFRTPIKCCVQLPSNVIMDATSSSSVLAAKWNMDEERWTSADIREFAVDKDSRTVSFQLNTPGIVGMLQTRQIDLNYKAWSLGPLNADNGEAVIEFKLCTPRYEVVFHITGSKCTLISPDIQELSEIRGTPQSPSQLLAALSRSGLHLLPSDSDAAKMGKSLKKCEIEESACCDIGFLSSAFFVKSSRFNSLLGRSQACYEIRESDVYTGGCDPSPMLTALHEIDSGCASVNNAPGAKEVPTHCGNVVRCSIVQGAEQGLETSADAACFNTGAKDGTESSLYMSYCLSPLSSAESMARIKSSSPLLSETVKDVLGLTRPFTFC
uniref:IC97/Casc1 N-terminal domain-containing protein n=1 Tax=Odontella aurita TaxID=265563 RepID=A0A7S4JDS1_9STRA|mmetsp:Transcript_44474/g.135569  ORF Transcript_44474/g.135569 Transcript_44474/m.135569 type:complete len:633 (+) Transcript_44474:2067-3965(+)